jgi:RNA polymerase sigma-70 factor (ECF subfamily)
MAATAPLKPLARAVLGTQSDARLVTLTREGSEDAFAEIVRRHRPGLLRFARALGSGERSEDVVQDGLVRAWKALRNSDAEIDLRPWLTTIVRNRAMSSHATVRHHEELDETIDGVRQPGDYALLHEELRSAVSAVNSLPDTQRKALIRSALDGESHETIAAELNTSPGAVRQLIFRARTGLRDGLGALVPLPAVRGLVELTTHEAAAGGTASGSAAAIAAGAGGGSIALKAVALVAVGAAVAGSGIAIERHRGAGNAGVEEAKAAPVAETTPAPSEATPAAGGTTTSSAPAGSGSTTSAESSTAAGDDQSDASRTTTQDDRQTTSPQGLQQGTQPAGDQPTGTNQPPPAGDATEPALNGTTTQTTFPPPPPPSDGTQQHHDGDRHPPGDQTQTQTQPPPPPPPDGDALQGDGFGPRTGEGTRDGSGTRDHDYGSLDGLGSLGADSVSDGFATGDSPHR